MCYTNKVMPRTKEQKLAYNRDYHKRNRAAINKRKAAYRREYHKNNPEAYTRSLVYHRDYHKRNREAIYEQRKTYMARPEIRARKLEYYRRYNAKNRTRGLALKRTYGITEQQYDTALIIQEKMCRYCGKPLGDDIHIDHDKETGRVRGLVHGKCNLNLISAHTVETANQLVAYLTETSFDIRTL